MEEAWACEEKRAKPPWREVKNQAKMSPSEHQAQKHQQTRKAKEEAGFFRGSGANSASALEVASSAS